MGPTIVSTAATRKMTSSSDAKKPTAKEKRVAEILARIKQTRKNLELTTFANEGSNESDNHGSEDGVPPEVLAEDAREADCKADRIHLEENYRECRSVKGST
jgi:hypothetical protein